MSITITILAAGIVVLVTRGHFTRAVVGRFQSAVRQVMSQSRPAEIRVDLGGVVEVDHAAVDAMLDTARTLAGAGTRMVVCNPSQHVRGVVNAGGAGHLIA